jgi:hypothetical protein
MGRVERAGCVPHVHVLIAVRIALSSVSDEPKIFEQPNQSLLLDGSVEDRDVDLVHSLNDGIVENDLQETFAQLEPVQLHLERANVQSALRCKSRLDVGVVFCLAFNLHVEKCNHFLLCVEADVRWINALAVEPPVEGLAVVVLPEAVEKRERNIDAPEQGLLDR